MQVFQWKNKKAVDADLFIRFEEKEIRDLETVFPGVSSACAEINGYYGFVNTEKKTFTPLRKPSLAFGGGYNGYLPYGEEIPNQIVDFAELQWCDES